VLLHALLTSNDTWFELLQ